MRNINFAIQVCDFLRIYSSIPDAHLIKLKIESVTGLNSCEVMAFDRKHEHMLKCREDALCLNIRKLESLTDEILDIILKYIEENIQRYEEEKK